MSETKDPGEKKLRVGKLTLKPRTETGVVRQSFSHGRSKQVVVEKVKRRSIGVAPEAKADPADPFAVVDILFVHVGFGRHSHGDTATLEAP